MGVALRRLRAATSVMERAILLGEIHNFPSVFDALAHGDGGGLQHGCGIGRASSMLN